MTTRPPPHRPFSIDAFLPENRDNWPQGVLDALTGFSQGDVVSWPPFFYFADPSRPVWARTRAYADDSEGPEVIEAAEASAPRYGLITSQTCDLVEEAPWPAIKPWIQIAPVEDRSGSLSGELRSLLRKGRGPLHLIYLPALDEGFWVADLRIEMPVEKGWLAGRARVNGFADEAAQRIVGQRIAKIRNRPAFDARFVEGVQKPLGDALRRLRQENRQMYERMDSQIDHLAVGMDSHLSPTDVQIVAIATDQVDSDVEEWWRGWWDTAIQAASEHELYLHPFSVRYSTEITLAEYQRLIALPLERVSQS